MCLMLICRKQVGKLLVHGDVTDIKDLKPITIKKQDGTVQVMHWDEAYRIGYVIND